VREPRQQDDRDGLRQPIGDLREHRADGVHAGLVPGQHGPGQDDVEVDERHQPDGGVAGMADPAQQQAGRTRRPRPADHQVGGRGREHHAGRESGQRGGRGAAEHQPGDRPTHPKARVQAHDQRERTEALPALQQTVQRSQHRVGEQRDREHQHAGRPAQVQHRGQHRHREQHERGDGGAEPEPEPDRAASLAPAAAGSERGHPQGHPGLHAQRRHDAHDEHRHQGAELAERGRHEQPRGDDGEHVARHVGAQRGRGHEQRLAPHARRPRGNRGDRHSEPPLPTGNVETLASIATNREGQCQVDCVRGVDGHCPPTPSQMKPEPSAGSIDGDCLPARARCWPSSCWPRCWPRATC